jgi:general secretion pathway protein C
MDLRRHSWVVTAPFILCAALIVAKTFNSVAEAALLPVPGGELTRKPTASAEVAAAALDVKGLARLTGLKLPEPVDPDPQPEPESDLLVKSSLEARLLGTLVAVAPEWSFASVHDLRGNRTQTLMVGDQILGATVLQIDRERLIIRNGKRREYIDAVAGTPMAVATNVVLPVAGGTTGPVLGAGIRCSGTGTCEIPRKELELARARMGEIAMMGRIVPAYENGQPVGFKIFNIQPNSVYTRLGIQNGDVIRRINGNDISSPERLLEIYLKLSEWSRVELEVGRAGSIVKQSYNIL